jgi:hypothetical protein
MLAALVICFSMTLLSAASMVAARTPASGCNHRHAWSRSLRGRHSTEPVSAMGIHPMLGGQARHGNHSPAEAPSHGLVSHPHPPSGTRSAPPGCGGIGDPVEAALPALLRVASHVGRGAARDALAHTLAAAPELAADLTA